MILGGTLLRNDFVEASIGLTLRAQKRHLADLHKKLVDEGRMRDDEHVVSLTNYQQGRFGRLPTHILVVTSARIAYTHDGGFRSIPLDDVDPSSISIRAGIVHGEITFELRDGETLWFRRGMSLAMQEVATAITSHGTPTPPPAAYGSVGTARSSRREPSLDERTQRGRGDGIVEFVRAITEPSAVAICGSPAEYGVFAVWALGPDLEQQELLVNSTAAYAGTRVFALTSLVRALKIETNGSWSITPTFLDELPRFGSGRTGMGDGVVKLNTDLAPITTGFCAHVEINSDPFETSAVTVCAHGEDSHLLVNGIPPYAGSIVVPPGTQFLEITAPGRWSIMRD